MIMIDVFDKLMLVVPIKGKTEEALASCMIECLHKMGKSLKYCIPMMNVLYLKSLFKHI